MKKENTKVNYTLSIKHYRTTMLLHENIFIRLIENTA